MSGDALVNANVKCNSCGAAFGCCDCRWSHGDDMPIATHSGTVTIGDLELRCHVLSDGRRIFEDCQALRDLLGGIGWKVPA
jgi:hypothetical protein